MARWSNHIKRTREEYLCYQREYASAVREDQRHMLCRLKEIFGCEDCGERDPVVLDFHHRDPATKKRNISTMTGHAWPGFLRELEKCGILCANCHRRHWNNEKVLGRKRTIHNTSPFQIYEQAS